MKKFPLIAVLPAAAILSACATGGASVPMAEALLAPTQGNTASGKVVFRQEGANVVVTAHITGLTPGAHGFHIHEKGDCTAPDGTSAGGHFNPAAKPHGNPEHAEHHAGDMPQLMADASGNANLTATLRDLSVSGGAANIVGRGLIVHAAADDFKTQPTGNSGARVACGVITPK